jgi:hypothetical protein
VAISLIVMNKFFQNKNVSLAIRVILGGIMMYASIDKMANPADFAKIVHNYHVLPVQLVNLLAVFLPWIELFTGLFMVVGKWEKGAALIYSTLLIIFILGLSQALIRGLDISCGCFSVKPSSTSEVWLRIVEDIVMLFFSINLYRNLPVNNKTETEKSLNYN